jgi:hypothetical protein
VVISHELFATADAEHASRAIAALAGTDVHVIATVRDPARQFVSAWQERVKQGSPRRFERGARRLRSEGDWTAEAQNLPVILDNWGADLPPDHVHVVTVPPSGSDYAVLWQRFAEVIGVDPTTFDPSRAPRTNESLGIAEVELLRRVNKALGGRVPHPTYGPVVTTQYANGILAAHRGSPLPTLPKRLRGEVDALAERWIGHIKERGYDVRGDLDDLRPRHRAGSPPSSVSEKEVADAAVRATADLLVAIAELRQPRAVARVSAKAAGRAIGYSALSALQSARGSLRRRVTRG